MPSFRKIRTLSTASIIEIQQPADIVVPTLHSPAAEVFTDFTRQNPLMLEQTTTIADAREMMKRTHVKLKLVIDSNEAFQGVITLEDLMSAKVVQAMEKTGLSRFELTVKQVMTPRSALHAIDIRDFELASIGDIVATMQKYGDQHVLVVDMKRGSIRGIVSANDIARRMHVPIIINERANSFSDICRAVTG
jgi:CBS domain containing-hemolysin-like protein